jgi:SAM-dependent methyltransferase
MQCCDCGLIYANPRPVPEALADHYGVAPEDYWRPEHLDAANDFRYYTDQFWQLWRGDGVPRALDVGAGVGRMMTALEHEGFDAFGLEPSPDFRDRAIATGVAPDRLELTAIENAHYEPDTFDFVNFSAVLEHVHDPAGAIERALDWTRPGGLLSVEVPSARWLLARMLNLTHRAQGLDYVTNLSPMHPPYHLYEFTPESFARHSRRAGYEVVEHRFLPGETFLRRGAAAVATKIMATTGTGMLLHVWLRPVPSVATGTVGTAGPPAR